MYNLMMVGHEGYWDNTDETEYAFDRVFEHSSQDLKNRFLPLTQEGIERLMREPTLFAYEFANRAPRSDDDWAPAAKLGKITRVEVRTKDVLIKFEIDPHVEPIQVKDLLRISERLDILLKSGESYRTHWAIKDVDLISVLKDEDLYRTIAKPSVHQELSELAKSVHTPGRERDRIFVVHGHEEKLLYQVARWLSKIELDEVILNEQANRGETVIEKFQRLAGRSNFAVVLLTPDDVGGRVGGTSQFRARQNVIFELGYFIGTLGRDRVAVIASDDVERPSDSSGLIFIKYDSSGKWKAELATEMAAAGLTFDLNKAI